MPTRTWPEGDALRRVVPARAPAIAGILRAVSTEPRPHTGHPLDPLTEDEIRAAAAAVRATHPELEDLRFPLLTLDEPVKDSARSHRPGEAIIRRAFAVV